MQITENSFKIIVKTNCPKNKIISYDSERKAYRVAIKAKPENNKANIEIIRFFSKLLKKKVSVIKGLKHKEKTLKTG